MLLFGLPFLPNGIAYVTIETVDRLLVQEFLGKDAVGLYSPNYKFGTILLMLVVAFRNAWQPFFLKVAKQENAQHLFSKVLTYFVVLGGLITLIATFFIEDILTIHYFDKFYILGSAYWEGIRIIPIIFLAYFCFGIYVVLTPGFYIEKKSQYMIFFTGSGAVVNIAANIILLPQLNIWGAAIATFLSYLTMALSIYWVSQKIYPIQIEWKKIAITILFMGSMILLFYSSELALWIRLCISLIAAACAFILMFDSNERSKLLKKLLKDPKSQ
jgi:O-antigen/teichoic acid export membrane protein